MNHTNHVKRKKKVLNYLKERRWDTLLLSVYKEIRSMFVWGKENDLENGLHIGLSDVSKTKKIIDCSGEMREINFMKARIVNIEFMIGDESTTNQFGTMLTIFLLINNRCHVIAKYIDDNLFDVEEFHESEEIETVLRGLEGGIRQRRLKEVREEWEKKESVYKDKFTFKSPD